MKQLNFSLEQLTGPARDNLRKLFASSDFLKLIECLQLSELKLSHEVGSLIRFRNGAADLAVPGLAEKLSDLEKVRNTLEILDRLTDSGDRLELLAKRTIIT